MRRTGTGVVARLAARRVSPGGTVTGLDLNEAMLEEAKRLASGQRLGAAFCRRDL